MPEAGETEIKMSRSTSYENYPMESAKGQFLVYETEDGRLKLDVRFEDESVWLSQKLMAELFQTTKQNISLHIQNIYEEGELLPEATVKKYLTVRFEGNREVRRLLDYYNLDMIISVGYRVRSHVATRFRIWATQQLTEFIKKGFLLDDERLKNPDLPFDLYERLYKLLKYFHSWLWADLENGIPSRPVAVILKNWNSGFRISALLNADSIKKLQIFMLQALIMIQPWRSV